MSSATEYPPLLSLAGGSTRTVLRAAILSIKAEAEVPTCVINKTTPLTYEWSELRTGGAFTSISAVSFELQAPIYIGPKSSLQEMSTRNRAASALSVQELSAFAYTFGRQVQIVLPPTSRRIYLKRGATMPLKIPFKCRNLFSALEALDTQRNPATVPTRPKSWTLAEVA